MIFLLASITRAAVQTGELLDRMNDNPEACSTPVDSGFYLLKNIVDDLNPIYMSLYDETVPNPMMAVEEMLLEVSTIDEVINKIELEETAAKRKYEEDQNEKLYTKRKRTVATLLDKVVVDNGCCAQQTSDKATSIPTNQFSFGCFKSFINNIISKPESRVVNLQNMINECKLDCQVLDSTIMKVYRPNVCNQDIDKTLERVLQPEIDSDKIANLFLRLLDPRLISDEQAAEQLSLRSNELEIPNIVLNVVYKRFYIIKYPYVHFYLQHGTRCEKTRYFVLKCPENAEVGRTALQV